MSRHPIRDLASTSDGRRPVLLGIEELAVVDLDGGSVRRARFLHGLAAHAISADGGTAALAWKQAPSAVEVWDLDPGD